MYRFLTITLLVIFTIFMVNGKLPINIPRAENVVIPMADEDIVTYRLPNDTRPEWYNIEIYSRIDEENFSFTGRVHIGILAVAETDSITLHARQLTIISAELWTEQEVLQIPIEPYTYDEGTEFLTITPSIGPLVAESHYVLNIEYSGTLREDNAGFYRSSYQDDDNNVRWLATTQFESTDARHGFPCYDEPALKANFTISITHGSTYHAVSNMPELDRVDHEDGTSTTSFLETPPTSTYLIAFIISDFDYMESSGSVHGIPHRVLSRPNAIEETYVTLGAGVAILDALIDYLDVPFSLPKMDQAAIPDFAAGAMENWGLVTYREPAFFYVNTTTQYATYRSIIGIIAHEFAHQWFGNLVSPRWWTYLWLNEGFATLYSNYATDLVYPEMKQMDYFVVATVQSVFNTDALTTTRPMSYYVESPGAIQAIFDNVAYAKSGSVLRMMQNAFTDASFRKGLNIYLNARAYNDAIQEDLFDGLEEAVKEDGTLADNLSVRAIFSSWSTQSGFPVLYANRNYADGSISISQERFLTFPDGTLSASTFWIPINYVTANNADFSETIPDQWLPQGTRLSTIRQTDDRTWTNDEWIVFNKQATGFYRVQYDRRNWNLITDELVNGDFEKIHHLSRSQLIDDAFMFARTRRLSWDVPLSLIQYVGNDEEYAPWATTHNHLNYLNRFASGLNEYELYEQYIGDLAEQLLRNVGFEDDDAEPFLRKYLRTFAIHWACTMGSEYCRATANNLLNDVMNVEEYEIHQNIRSVLYCAGMRNADEEQFQYFFSRINDDELDSTLQNDIITGLSCISDLTLLSEYLSHSLDTNYPPHIRESIFNNVFQNSNDGLLMAIQFLNDNFEYHEIIFGDVNSLQGSLYVITQHASNEQALAEVELLLEHTNELISPTQFNALHNNIFENIQWLTNFRDVIDAWLTTNVLVEE